MQATKPLSKPDLHYRADVIGSMLRPPHLLQATKTPREETASELRARINEASAYIPLDRLALSPQCGFASVAKGNAISFETQEKKLRLVAEVARQVWSD